MLSRGDPGSVEGEKTPVRRLLLQPRADPGLEHVWASPGDIVARGGMRLRQGADLEAVTSAESCSVVLIYRTSGRLVPAGRVRARCASMSICPMDALVCGSVALILCRFSA